MKKLISVFFFVSFIFNSQVGSETLPSVLGEPCLAEGAISTKPTFVGKKEIELAQKTQRWDAIIEKRKASVQEDCKVPHRWKELFDVFVNANKYKEAVDILNEMKNREMTIPGIVLEKSSTAFLQSTEFTNSDFGKRFQQAQALTTALINEAKLKIASMSEKEKPPTPYEAEGACPFECCQLGKWKTRETTQLLQEIRSTKIVSEVPSKTEVVAIESKVIKDPEPYIALESRGIVKQGDVIFMLDYQGEGSIAYWYKGKRSPDLQTGFDTNNFYENDQANSTEKRWLRKVYPEKKFADEWWAKLRLSDGRTGWVLSKGQFDGTDACGS